MKRWLGLAIAIGAIAGAIVWISASDSSRTDEVLAAEQQFQQCVEHAGPPRVGGGDGSLACLQKLHGAIPRCGQDAAVPIGQVIAFRGGTAMTTDDGHGSRCAMVEQGDPHAPACASAALALRGDGLTAKHFTGPRCPRLHGIERGLRALESGRIGLTEFNNRFNLEIALARDGVPTGGGFRQLPPRHGRPVPAVSRTPTAAACSSAPSAGRLAVARIEADVPFPRCLMVGPDQGLRIFNDTGRYGSPRTITVRFIGYSARVKPDESAVFRRRLGTYVSRGIHYVRTSLHGNGPEIFLLGQR